MKVKPLNPAIFAILKNPNNGYESDRQQLIKAGICQGQKFELRDASVDRWHTTVYLKGFTQGFNSVHFDFVDGEGEPVDIVNMRQFHCYF